MAVKANKNAKSTKGTKVTKKNAKADAKAKSVKKAEKKTREVVKEEVIVKRSLKWVYPADCTSKSDKKAFRTQARAKIAKWDKLLTDKVNSKKEKLSKKELKSIAKEKATFEKKYVNSNYQAAKQWVD